MKPVLQLFVIFLLVIHSQKAKSQELVINEVMSDNESFDFDGLGNTPDWIELYNVSGADIDVGQYSIRFDSGQPVELPPFVLSPESFVLLFLAETPPDAGDQMYIDNPISRMGAQIELFGPNEIFVDEVRVPTLIDDMSFGRVANGTGLFGLLPTATPGSMNAEGGISCSESTGFFNENFAITLSSSSEAYSVRYSLDGSVPTVESPAFEGPIEIEEYSPQDYSISSIPTDPPDQLWNLPDYVIRGTVLRAATFIGDTRVSPVLSRTFFVGEGIASRYTFPVISILADSVDLFSYDTGIYVPGITFDNTSGTSNPQGNYDMRGAVWEREAHLTFLEPDETIGFESNVGIRIRGGWTPRLPQKSLNVYFRAEYGLKDINYDLFTNSTHKRHKRLVLRNSGNDFFHSRFRDILCHDLFKDEGLEYQGYRPNLLFVNGEYWGIKNIREKYDEHYLKRHFGGDTDDYDIVGVCGNLEHGEVIDYDELLEFVDMNDLSEFENYSHVEERLDIDNFIDYNIAEIFFANQDWPCNNHRFWKSENDTARWRVLIYDMDQTFGYSQSSFDTPSLDVAVTVGSFPNCECSNRLLRKLLENDMFRDQFIEQFYCQMQTTYSSANIVSKIDELSDIYEPEISEHAARWGYPWNVEMWNIDVGKLRTFAELRTSFMKQHIAEFFNIENLDFECTVPIQVEETGLIIYPNPTTGVVKVHNDTHLEFRGVYMLNDVQGQIIMPQHNIALDRGETTILNLTSLASGHYLLKIQTDQEVITKSIVLQ